MKTTPKIAEDCETERHGSVKVCLYLGFSIENGAEDESPYTGAQLKIYREENQKLGQVPYEPNTTGEDGCREFSLQCGRYFLGLPIPPNLIPPSPSVPDGKFWTSPTNDVAVRYDARLGEIAGPITIKECTCETVKLRIPAARTYLAQTIQAKGRDCTWVDCSDVVIGQTGLVVSTVPKTLAVEKAEYFLNERELPQLEETTKAHLGFLQP